MLTVDIILRILKNYCKILLIEIKKCSANTTHWYTYLPNRALSIQNFIILLHFIIIIIKEIYPHFVAYKTFFFKFNRVYLAVVCKLIILLRID